MVECFTENEYNKSKAMDKLLCKCLYCSAEFPVLKKSITYERLHKQGKIQFCNKECMNKYRKKENTVSCKLCGIVFQRRISQCSKNNFCSHTCSAKYTNKHRICRPRRPNKPLTLDKMTIIITKYQSARFLCI
jgi:hypothetical protein